MATFYCYFIYPVYRATRFVLLLPVYAVALTYFTITRRVLPAVARVIAASASWVYREVLCPAARFLRVVTQVMYGRVLRPLGRSIRAAARFVWHTVLLPLSRVPSICAQFAQGTVAPAVRRGALWFRNSVLLPVTAGCKSLARVTFDFVITPAGRACGRGARYAYFDVLVPGARYVVDAGRVFAAICGAGAKHAVASAAQAAGWAKQNAAALLCSVRDELIRPSVAAMRDASGYIAMTLQHLWRISIQEAKAAATHSQRLASEALKLSIAEWQRLTRSA